MLAVSEDRTGRLRASVAGFHVLAEYSRLESEADQLTSVMGELSNANVLDRQLVESLRQALEEETIPRCVDIDSLYSEIGVALPGVSLRRFEDVRQFHESVVRTRRSHLDGEIEDARRRIAGREQQIQRAEERRASIMGILQSHGALEQYTKLQSELARLQSETENLRQKYQTAEQLASGRTELGLERARLQRRLQREYQERADVLRHGILAFEEVSEALYEDAGSLTIKDSPNGPKIEVRIHGERSRGISNMQIFCFDVMMSRLCSERGSGPGFLIHDSHMFDGVDERQIAHALRVGHDMATRFEYQYIVCMNSDILPRERLGGFDAWDYVLPTRLTDATDDGGLFGIRFG
jgi:uncharacterized protein YydD (DUF2326 family)